MPKRFFYGPWNYAPIVGLAPQGDDDGKSWQGPPGTVRAIDLRPVHLQEGKTEQGFGVFLLDDDAPEPGSDYEHLGDGDWQEAKTDTRAASMLAVGNKRPEGDTVARVVWNLLTDLADPLGLEGPKPIDAFGGRCELTVGFWKVRRKLARSGRHFNNLLSMRQAYLQECYERTQAGELPDSHHRKCLDDLCYKMRLHRGEDWRALVPRQIRDDFGGRLRRETTYTLTFDGKTPGTMIGDGWSDPYTGSRGSYEYVSSAYIQAQWSTSSAGWIIYDLALSSTDHYADIERISTSDLNGHWCGATRCATGATRSCYLGDVASSSSQRLYKLSGGTRSQIGSASATTSYTGVSRTQAIGSTQSYHEAGSELISVTDTTHTTYTNCGLGEGAPDTAADPLGDNAVIADVGGGSATIPIIMQLF